MANLWFSAALLNPFQYQSFARHYHIYAGNNNKTGNAKLRHLQLLQEDIL